MPDRVERVKTAWIATSEALGSRFKQTSVKFELVVTYPKGGEAVQWKWEFKDLQVCGHERQHRVGKQAQLAGGKRAGECFGGSSFAGAGG